MLARARFETETPNVIDAGEDAPPLPSRQEPGNNGVSLFHFHTDDDDEDGVYDDSSSAASTTLYSEHSRPMQQHEQQPQQQQLYAVSNKGHISKGRRINYSLEADEEPDVSPSQDVEDQNYTVPSGASLEGFSQRELDGSSEGYGGLEVRKKRSNWVSPNLSKQPATSAQDNQKSIREARLFAAAMLNESERRFNLHNEHILSSRQESTSSLRHVMTRATSFRSTTTTGSSSGGGGGSRRFYDEIDLVDDTPSVRPHDPKRFRRSVLCRVMAALVTIILVIIFFVFVTKGIRENDTQRQSGSEIVINDVQQLDDTVEYLFNIEVSLARDLYDETTPQYQAARWLALEDPEQLAIPPIDGGIRSGGRFVQRYALAVLFFALGGDRWVNRYNFATGIHECSWFESSVDPDVETYALGVICNSNLEVENLVLPSNNLNGTIPPEIEHLSELNFLDLRNNTLTGTFPTALESLSLLDYLNLNQNQLTGTIPLWLGESLTKLRALGLSDNFFVGSIPSSFATGLASELKTLSLDGNMLTGDIASLEYMRYLQYLYLNDNDFTGRLDRGIFVDIPFLEELDLSGNQITNEVPDYLFQMRSLKVMDLSDNYLTGPLPSDIRDRAEKSSLEFVSFRNNSMSESIPNELMAHLKGLNHLDLSFNQFTGDSPEAIGEMTDLSYLFLGHNSLSVSGGSIPIELSALTKLRELSLGNLAIGGNLPSWLENLEQLRLLDLSGNNLTGDIVLDFEKLNQLRYLLLHENLLTGTLPESMSTLDKLIVLSLHQNDIIDADTSLRMCAAASGLEFATVDCEEIECPCCDECCDGPDCFQRVVWQTLQHSDGQWEKEFQRSDYGFDPRITLSEETFFEVVDCGDHCA